MPIIQVIILAIVQGLAELLPVSSSAHVVVAEKLLGLDPSSPQMTLVLVMLHTGTMFAVIAYFWKQWKRSYFATADAFKRVLIRIIWATLLTGLIGEVIIKIIEKTAFRGAPKAEIELLFGRLELVAPALAAAGVIILIAGLLEKRRMAAFVDHSADLRAGATVTMKQAGWIGAVQGSVSSVPWILALGCDDLYRNAVGRNEGAGGTVQLCTGSCADPAGGAA